MVNAIGSHGPGYSRGTRHGATLRSISDRLLSVWSPTEFERRRILRKLKRANLSIQQIELEHGSMSCWVGGSGPPLLLLHGFGASAPWQFHPQVPALAKRFTLYIPDLLFFGGSTSPHNDRSLDFQVEAVLGLMDHFGVDQCHTLGISYGGFVAYLLAANFPARVSKLVLTNSPGAVMTADDYATLLDNFEVTCITELLLPTGPAGVRRLLDVAYYRPPWVPRFALIDARRQLFMDQVEQKRQLLKELVGYLDAPPLPQGPLDHQTLIVWGEHDRVFPVGIGRRLARSMGSRARLEVLDRAAHAPNLEAVSAFNRLVLEFLDDE